jgi:hypothetical protein
LSLSDVGLSLSDVGLSLSDVGLSLSDVGLYNSMSESGHLRFPLNFRKTFLIVFSFNLRAKVKAQEALSNQNIEARAFLFEAQ